MRRSGCVFATWGSALLVRQLSTWQSTVSLDLALDWRVLAFTAILACLSAIAAGVAPMIGLKSVAAGEALKDAGRSVAGDRRFAVRGALVVAQIAVSLVLVIAAGLFLRTFVSLNQLPLGFVPEPLLVVDLNLQASGAPPETRARTRRAAARRRGGRTRRAIGLGLRGAAAHRRRLVHQQSGRRRRAHAPEDRARIALWRNATTPGWFETMGIPARGPGLQRQRSCRRSARRHRQSGVRAPLSASASSRSARRYASADRTASTRYEIVGLVGRCRLHDAARRHAADDVRAAGAARRRAWTSGRPSLLTIKAAPGQRAAVERDVAAALDADRPDASRSRSGRSISSSTRR